MGVECSGTAQFAIPKVLHWHNKLYYDYPMLLLSLEPFPFQITLKLSPNEVLNDGSHLMPDGAKKKLHSPLSFCTGEIEASTPPGHLTVHRDRGGGNLNVALEGWGI